jgi:hypothetical protein
MLRQATTPSPESALQWMVLSRYGTYSGATGCAVVRITVTATANAIYSFANELMSRSTPVILATGYAQSQVPEQYSKLPQLTKPLREAALVRLIEHTFRP